MQKNLNVLTYNFKKNFVNLITSKNMENLIQFISGMIEEVKIVEDIDLIVLDAERILQTKKETLMNNYKRLITEIDANIQKSKHTLVIIIGIDKFILDLENGEEELHQLFNKANEIENYSFILAENFTRFKNHEYDEWYKNYITGDTGIWIGNGITDQYLINVDSSGQEMKNNCGDSFGYMINQGLPTMIKVLGIKEKGDDNG